MVRGCAKWFQNKGKNSPHCVSKGETMASNLSPLSYNASVILYSKECAPLSLLDKPHVLCFKSHSNETIQFFD